MNLQEVLELLYKNEINCGVESFWDGGYTAWIGYTGLSGPSPRIEKLKNCLPDLEAVSEWLLAEARERYTLGEEAK